MCQELTRCQYNCKLQCFQPNLTLLSNKHVSLPSILSEIRRNEVNENAHLFINVRRSQLWVDSCRHITKSKCNQKAVVSIKFANYHGSSEGALTMGGPRREYFWLLIRAANLESGISCGPEDNRMIFPNATGTQKNINFPVDNHLSIGNISLLALHGQQ